MPGAALHHAAVDAALSGTASLLGMEVVFIGVFDDTGYTFERVSGRWPGLSEGLRIPAADTLCRRMLDGAPPATDDAAHDPAYADAPARAAYAFGSYVGVPIRTCEGRLVGTLCGADHGQVAVDETRLGALQALAAVVGALVEESQDAPVVIRRLRDGWRVGGQTEASLTSAMALADLLGDDVTGGARPERVDEEAVDEVERLRVSVRQLEHALAARVVVEQAIGVLAERQQVAPRAAFDRLRRAARSRGRRVHDLAREVVASVGDPTVPLPPELVARRG